MVKVICEIASAHGGSLDELFDLFNHASQTGADFVKIQIYDFDSLVGKTNERFKDLKSIELSPQNWTDFLNFSIKSEISVIGEFFDCVSLKRFGTHPGINAFKIPISDLEDLEYRRLIKSIDKPVFLAASGALQAELDQVVSELTAIGRELVLLLGFQSFPTKLEDSFLAKIRSLVTRYEVSVGYADHVDSNNKFESVAVPLMAIAAGAEYIEKHITKNRSLMGFDYYSALNPDEFADFVTTIRHCRAAMGTGNINKMSAAEQKYRATMRKFAVASTSLIKGQKLAAEDVVYRRIDKIGLTRSNINKHLGEKIDKDVSEGEPISKEVFNLEPNG